MENKFAQVAADPRFRFFGNVNVVASSEPEVEADDRGTGKGGRREQRPYPYPMAAQLPIDSLLPHYTHLLLSYGCSLARTLGVPGSEPGELGNVHAALDFVNWYNGHPAAHDDTFLSHEPWRRMAIESGGQQMRHATVVGAGNVALDVARILLRARSTLHDLFEADSAIKSRAALRETDVPEPVLAALSQSRIDHVDIVARRGPAQVAFTNKELREMMELQDVRFLPPKPEHMALAKQQVQALEAQSKGTTGEGQQVAASEARVRKRLLSIIEKGSATGDGRVSWAMDFFKGPKALLPADEDAMAAAQHSSARVARVRWDEMEFEPVPSVKDRDQPWSGGGGTGQRVRSTGRQTESQTDLVIASVGYKAAPLDNASYGSAAGHGVQIPWDSGKGVVPNRGGQAIDSAGNPIPGVYVSGWLARGPVGVIASTRIDANSVVEQMLHDWQTSNGATGLQGAAAAAAAANDGPVPGAPSMLQHSTQRIVSWQDWLRLDDEEVRRGQTLGKLREKVLSVNEMLRIIG